MAVPIYGRESYRLYFFEDDFLAPFLLALRARVLAAFFADADLAATERAAEARPPNRPPFFAGALLTFLPRPEPLFFPPPVLLLTVAHARRSASSFGIPRSSYPSSIWSA